MDNPPNNSELARAWGVTRQTIYVWRKRGINPLNIEAVIHAVTYADRYDYDLIAKLETNRHRVEELIQSRYTDEERAEAFGE